MRIRVKFFLIVEDTVLKIQMFPKKMVKKKLQKMTVWMTILKAKLRKKPVLKMVMTAK